MSLRIEHLIPPFSSMNEDEQLALIREIRRKRFFVKPSKPKVAAERKERKQAAKSKKSAKTAAAEYLASLSPEERKAVLAKLGAE